MLETQFQKIGLNDNEREVYLAILKAGKTTHERVARASGVNRTTVYSISEKLKRLGLISEDLGGKISYLIPEGIVAVSRLFDKQERELAEKKKAAQEIAEQIVAITSGKNYSIPRIRFVEEGDLNDFLYKRYAEWAKSGLAYDNTWWGYHDSSFTEQYGDFIDWSWKQGPAGLKVRFLTNAAPVEKEMEKKHPERLTRTIPEGEFDSSLWVNGDYILMVHSRERPHYLVEIHDPVLARNHRQLFKNLWDVTK